MPHPRPTGPLITTAVVMLRSRSPGIATQLCRQLAPGKTHSHDQAHDTDQGPLARPGVAGIGTASFLADVGHEIPTALLPNLSTVTLGAPAAALGLIEGIADGLAGAAGWPAAPSPTTSTRRRAQAVAGDTTTTAVLSSLIQGRHHRLAARHPAGRAWAARGLRVPPQPCWPTSSRPASMGGLRVRAGHGQPRRHPLAPLLALALVGLVGVRTAIALSIIPGPLAALAIVYAIRHTPGRAAGAATAAATGAAGAGRAAGSAHGRGVGL